MSIWDEKQFIVQGKLNGSLELVVNVYVDISVTALNSKYLVFSFNYPVSAMFT